MKVHSKNLKILLALIAVGVYSVLGVNSVRGAIKLPDLNIPANSGYVFTPTFKVPGLGELKITVKIKTTVAGNSPYEIHLLKGRTQVQKRQTNAGPFYKIVELKHILENCNQVGLYKIRIKNKNTSSPKPGKVAFNPFDPPRSGTNNCRNPSRPRNQMSSFLGDRPIIGYPFKPLAGNQNSFPLIGGDPS